MQFNVFACMYVIMLKVNKCFDFKFLNIVKNIDPMNHKI